MTTVQTRLFSGRLGTFTVYGVSVLLPVLAAATSSVAGAHHGPVRVYWTLGAIASTLGVALSNVIKEIRAKATKLASANAQQKLRVTLAEASMPLVTALGRVAASKDPGKLKEAVKVLLERAVSTTRAQCGSGTRESYRSTFYSLVGKKLERVIYEGREGSSTPRMKFDPNGDEDDDARAAVRLAMSEEVLLVKDLHNEAPSYIANPNNKSYRTMLSVPVNANHKHFGLLTLDSPEGGTINDIDKKYSILIAGVLGVGLAQLEQQGFTIVENGEFEEEGEQGEQSG